MGCGATGMVATPPSMGFVGCVNGGGVGAAAAPVGAVASELTLHEAGGSNEGLAAAPTPSAGFAAAGLKPPPPPKRPFFFLPPPK
eukprot:3256151-Pleurochrysis_carterae.AAC.1